MSTPEASFVRRLIANDPPARSVPALTLPPEAAKLDDRTGSSSAVKFEIFVTVSRARPIMDETSLVQSAVMANAPASCAGSFMASVSCAPDANAHSIAAASTFPAETSAGLSARPAPEIALDTMCQSSFPKSPADVGEASDNASRVCSSNACSRFSAPKVTSGSAASCA